MKPDKVTIREWLQSQHLLVFVHEYLPRPASLGVLHCECCGDVINPQDTYFLWSTLDLPFPLAYRLCFHCDMHASALVKEFVQRLKNAIATVDDGERSTPGE